MGVLASYDQEISGFIDRNLVVNIKERELYPVSRLTGYSTRQKEIKAAIFSTPVSTLYSNWLQFSSTDQSSGTTAGEYALPAVQSKLRELRRRLAPPALCPRVQITVSHNNYTLMSVVVK